MMPAHNFGAYPKTQPGAGDSLGGEERIEHPALNLRIDAGAGIGHGEHDSASARSPISAFPASNQETPPMRHGIDRVGDEITESLTDIVFKAGDGPTSAFSLFDGDPRVHQPGFMQAEDGGE